MAVDRLVHDRLRGYLGEVNLFNYEGTVLDQLALHYLQDNDAKDKVHIFCSDRPCMAPELRREIQAFAADNGLYMLSYEKDCVLEPNRTGFIHTECARVGPYIKAFLQGKHGVQIVASILNDDTHKAFTGMNDYFKIFDVENGCYASNRDARNDWHTLFLFEQCRPLDVVAAYTYHLGRLPAACDIPLCYLPCYNERELMKTIELIETSGVELLAAVARLRARPAN